MTTQPKKVLYLLPQPFMLTRGSSFRAYSTVKAMAEIGLDVDVLSYPIGRDIPPDPLLRVIRWWSLIPFRPVRIGPSLTKMMLDIPFFMRCIYQALIKRYDAIHGVEEAGFVATLLGRTLGIPYVYDMHSWMSQQIEDSGFVRLRPALSLFKRLEMYCMRRAAAIITVGQTMTDILKTIAPNTSSFVLKDRAIDIPPSFDQEEVKLVKDKYHLEGKKVFLYTGNFEIYQGIDLLLESFATFLASQERRESFVLLLVGGGAGQEENMSKYREMAKALWIHDNTIFAGEWPIEKMPVFMSVSDLLISPRVHGNNVPFKVYTYMASGKLTLATSIESHTQVLNSENCVLRPPTPAAFADGMKEAIDPSLKDIHATRAKNAAVQSSTNADKVEFRDAIASCYQWVFSQSQELARYHLAVLLIPLSFV